MYITRFQLYCLLCVISQYQTFRSQRAEMRLAASAASVGIR